MVFLFRILPLVIIAFWLTMTALLVRVNVSPDNDSMLQVPVDHVMRVIFLHGLNSDLNILKNRERVGNLSLRPHAIEAGMPRQLDFTGNVLVDSAILPRQTFRWQGSTRLSKSLEMESLSVQLDLRKPNMRFGVELGRDQVLHYSVEQGGQAMETRTLPLDAHLADSLLQSLGLDPSSLDLLPGGMDAPTVTAQQNHIHLRNEEIEVYQVTIRQGELELATLYVSQLGQVLLAQTIFGYSLQAEEISL